VGSFVSPAGLLDHRDDRQLELHRELVVAFVVRRDGHDGAGTVAHQHVVGDPDGHARAVDGIDGVGAAEDAGLFLGQIGALEVALGRGGLAVGVDRRPVFRGGEGLDQRVLRGEDHVGAAEERVRAGGEDLQRSGAGRFEGEQNLRAVAAADPGLLHPFRGFRPVDVLEVGQQALRIGGDAQHPLAQVAAFDRKAADLALAVDNLLVGQHGAELRAPPHRALVDIGEAALEQLEEDPLRPAEVLRIRGVDFPLPVVGEAERLDLAPEVRDVVAGCWSPGGCRSFTACCSAGRPKASQPIGCRTLKPFARL
jgi:hypothetical protein